MKCKRFGCGKSATPKDAYCSPECAPYAFYDAGKQTAMSEARKREVQRKIDFYKEFFEKNKPRRDR